MVEMVDGLDEETIASSGMSREAIFIPTQYPGPFSPLLLRFWTYCYSDLDTRVMCEELLQAAQSDPELLKLLRDQTTQELDTHMKKESDAAAEPVVQI